jgi:hypothetical protein
MFLPRNAKRVGFLRSRIPAGGIESSVAALAKGMVKENLARAQILS